MTEANEELVNTLTLAAILGGLIHVGQQFREHDLKDAFFRRNPRPQFLFKISPSCPPEARW